jgi:hypothetical protein
MKGALERLAADWVALAEQVERIDGEKPLHDKKIIALSANRHTRELLVGIIPPRREVSLGVMAQKSALSYRVSRNGPAGDWYWEVMSDRKIIDRGLAPTRAQARALALRVVASLAVRQPEDSTPPFEVSRL